MTDDRATLQSGGSVPAPTSSSTTTMASTFVCNMSLPLKLEIQSGNLSKEWKLWRHVWDAYEEVTDLAGTNRIDRRVCECSVRALAETCDFGALRDQLFRDRIECAVRDNAQLKEMAPNQQQQHSSEVGLVTQGYSIFVEIKSK